MAANASIVAAAFVLSRLLGLLREMLIAARFGTSENYDAYVAAFRIPDLLFLVVMSGAFGSAFIPIFGGFLSRSDEERAWRLSSAVLTYTLVSLLIVGQFVFFFAGPIMERIVAPGLAPEQQQIAANLTRLLLLSPLLLGLGAAAKGMLEAQDAFTIPAIAPVLYNFGIIAGAIFLVPAFGVYGLAVGVIAGAASHAGVQFISLVRRGMRFYPTLARDTEGLGQVARLMAPRILGQAAFQVNFIVMTNFASQLGESRVSAMNYAYQLSMLPHGVLALSLSTVIFPLMARQYELGRLSDLKQTLTNALGPLLFLTLPSAVGLYAFRTSIVQIIFQFGSFSSESTRLVSDALGYFAFGLLAFAVVEAVARAFYAMHDTKTPVIASVATIAANIVLSRLLAPALGHGGLALSISITTTIEMVVLLAVFQRRSGGISSELLGRFVRMLVAATVLAGVSLWLAPDLARATDPDRGRSFSALAAFVFTLGAVGATYVVATHLLKVPEVAGFSSRVMSRLKRLTSSSRRSASV